MKNLHRAGVLMGLLLVSIRDGVARDERLDQNDVQAPPPPPRHQQQEEPQSRQSDSEHKDSSSHDFGYDGSMGPDHWSSSFDTCAGKYQSPIDIDLHTVQTVSLPPIKYHGFNVKPLTSTLTNNGHTVVLQMESKEPMTISGGPLRGKYVFQQLHWHWGFNDSVGSEDTINHQSFPMELHMVFYRSIYGTFNGALKYHDGLAVLAFFYEVIGQGDSGNNNAYAEMVEHLPSVVLPNSQAKLARQLPMDALLPKHRTQYFTYNGSLTTPPCSEVVTWIDFKQSIRLSHDQVDEFRRLQTSGGQPLTHNNRPTQPLGDRVVYFNDNDDEDGGDSSASPLMTHILVLPSLLALTLYLC